MDINYKKLIDCFDTCKCVIFYVDTGLSCFNEEIYGVISIHKVDGKINIRFGNKLQAEGMIKTYVRT